jgi:tRNA (adenine57-N1/adenine58-N1)-methyltransferase
VAVLLVHGDREYLRERGDRLETDLGVLEVPEDASHGQVVESHLGEPFEVRELRGPDLFDHMERTGAPMMPRDVGLVMGHVGAGPREVDRQHARPGAGVEHAVARADAGVAHHEADVAGHHRRTGPLEVVEEVRPSKRSDPKRRFEVGLDDVTRGRGPG